LISEKEKIYYELLIHRCWRRDNDAFEELIQKWEKPLFYYIRRLVDSEKDTWDLLQQTWLKVIQGIGRLKEPQSLPAWLYRIARNTVMSYLREKYSNKVLIKNKEDISNIGTDSEAIHFEDAEQVHYGLNKLSLAHREVLTLYFLEDFSVSEIAEVLEISPGTVKSRLYHAKRALRAILEKED